MTCSRFLTIALISVISFQQAIALKCWHCDSVQNDYCGEPFIGDTHNHSSTYVECPPKSDGGNSVCVKTKVKPSGVIIRQCASNEEDAQRVCSFGLKSAEYCITCRSDGCNGASNPVAIAFPMLIVTILLLA